MSVKNKKNFKMTGFSLALAGVVSLSIMLTGCDLAENHLRMDRAANMEFQDFRDGLAPRQDDQDEYEYDDDIPELQSYVAGVPENLKPMPLVSISINQTVPLRDALFELAEQADFDIELDPRIRGSVIYTARNRPFDVVISRIADIAGLRYSFEDDVLRIELDRPYTKTYKIGYLSYIRSNTSSIRNDVSVMSGEGADTGSSFEAQGRSEADFWGELVTNLEQILGVPPSRGMMRTGADPRIEAVDSSAPAVQPVVVDSEDGGEGPVVQVQPPQASLRVSSLPIDAENGDGAPAAQSSFAINRQAGIVSAYTTERNHKEIQEYLDLLQIAVTAQVLIEAKVLEVSLEDEYSTGIDWNSLSLTGQADLDITFPRPSFSSPMDPVGSGVQLAVSGTDVGALINAVSRFGTIRALASPRLTVLNNQSAVLNVARNYVYFELDVDVVRDELNNERTEIDSQIRSVPEGVLINVQPSINLDNRSISMSIRPTITTVVDEIADPSVAFIAASVPAAADLVSNVPVVNVQEFDSVISMNSGEAVIMGGLMQDRVQSTQQGVPVLKEIPLVGGLFRAHVDSVNKTELIVFLKATIIDAEGNVHETDKEIYKRFSGDRRPLRF